MPTATLSFRSMFTAEGNADLALAVCAGIAECREQGLRGQDAMEKLDEHLFRLGDRHAEATDTAVRDEVFDALVDAQLMERPVRATGPRQMIHIATNALLERIAAEGCHYGIIVIETGIVMGKGRTRTRATATTTRIADRSRSPQEVVITSACDSDEAVATVEVLG
jgi:hypothetical protein